MSESKLITRRQALISLSAFTASALVAPAPTFALQSPRLRFAVIGDWGTGKQRQFKVAAQMLAHHQRKRFDFVLTAGDNIYPDGNRKHITTHFERPYGGLLDDRVSFHATLGNHDIDARKDQIAYPLFNMSNKNYYTLTKGDGLADIFMLDSTDLFRPAQLGWLEASLRASKAPWKLAVVHHPLYSSGKKHGSTKPLRVVLEPLLKLYGVKVVFSGHDHIYERVIPQQGIHHFVTGAAGKVRIGDVDMGTDFRAASYDEGCHFMLVELDDKEMSFQAISEDGVVVDSGVIKRG